MPGLQVNELQLHGGTKHRAAALISEGVSCSGLDWESRTATRCRYAGIHNCIVQLHRT